MLGELRAAEVAEPLVIRLQAPDATDLLHDWLAELLFLFEARRLWVDQIAFDRLDETSVSARGRGRRVDVKRSRFDGEVKAVTYHGLHVQRRGERFEATVILDL